MRAAGVSRPLFETAGVSPLTTDLDSPLGQGRRPGRSAAGIGRRIPYSGIVSAIVVLGLSTFIATRDEGIRYPAPPPIEVAAEKTIAPAAPERTPVAKAERPAGEDGPSIIRVNPEPSGSQGVIVVRDPSQLTLDPRLAHIPDRDLIEQSDDGPLPVRSPDGRRPFDVYAGKWSGTRGAKVAIVVGGLGVSQTGTQSAIAALPSEVTLAFAPQGNSLGRWMQAGRREGHEIVMQLPLEPFDYPRVNPGRNTLTVDAGQGENIDRMLWALGRTTNYVGVVNYMGARFVADGAAMKPILDELGRRGLMYLDDGTTARSAAIELAPASAVPFAAADQVIDTSRDRGEILKKLDQLEAMARAKGSAIGIGSAFDTTVAAIASWVNEAKKRGIEIVPVSALAADPERTR